MSIVQDNGQNPPLTVGRAVIGPAGSLTQKDYERLSPTEAARVSAAIMLGREQEEAKENIRLAALAITNDPTLKPSNPKDAIGSDKMPLHLWPETATVLGCLGLLDGALKYGRANWREAGVRASIYYDALRRHLAKQFEGQDIDTDSGLPHDSHMLACLAIIVDAKAAGKYIDDRQYRGEGFIKLLEEMTPHVARLKKVHAGKTPKHWTIADDSKA